MFMSEYNHTIDAKGRLIIPSKFRDELGEEFVVSRGLDACLYIYAKAVWEEVEKSLSELSMLNKNSRQIARYMLAGAAEVEFDKQGRILVPTNLREHAKLNKDVVLVGMGRRIEIWDKDQYENESADIDMDSITENLDAVGIQLKI